MGNSSSSSKTAETRVDQGFLTPHGIYTGPHDWNQHVVGHLILERRLAPFYRPLEDYDENWDDEMILSNRRGPDTEADQPTSSSHDGHKHSKSHHRPKEHQKLNEAQIYRGAVECPICFMYYPSNINRSRCCFQAICTECFVQIKRNEPTPTHLVSEPACCPYCQQENFGVTYTPPPWRSGLLTDANAMRPDMPTKSSSTSSESSRRKSLSHDNPNVVTIDQIRPDWEERLAAVKAAVARRANRRIIMRQVGDRLIPVGVTSSRTQLPEGITTVEDIEELMLMEAMRLSLLEHERSNANNNSATSNSSVENQIPAGNTISPSSSSSATSTGDRSTGPTADESQEYRQTTLPFSNGINTFITDAPASSTVPSSQLERSSKDTSQSATNKNTHVAMGSNDDLVADTSEQQRATQSQTLQDEACNSTSGQVLSSGGEVSPITSPAAVGWSMSAKDTMHVIPTNIAGNPTAVHER